MPEDYLIEAKSVLNLAGKFYGTHIHLFSTFLMNVTVSSFCIIECPRGHPYFVSEVIELK